MAKKIYGVDPTESITAEKVRDAIIKCFYQAHCSDTGFDKDDVATINYCENIVRKAFIDTGGKFDKPTKESILKVMDALAEFSKAFRDQETIHKHMNEIQILVKKLD